MAAPPPPRPPPWPPSLDCVAFPWGSHRSGVAGDWADAAAATWAVDKGATDGGPLFFSSGELVREIMHPVRQADPFQ